MAEPVRVAVLDDYQGVALSSTDWSPLQGRAAVDVFRDHLDDPDELRARLEPFDVVVAMRERTPFPRELLAGLPRLRLLVTTGPRNAAIDVDACAELGVTLCGTSGSVQSTVELTWALILACARHLPTEVDNVREGRWMTTMGTDLAGATLGLLGLGRIGGAVARIGAAFGMDLIAWSENLTVERCTEVGARLVGRRELFERSTVLSVHLVLSERTRGLVGPDELAAMAPGSILVNTSRGPIVQTDALVERLRAGTLRAGLDTFDVEPLPLQHPLRTLPTVVPTPHIGYVSENVYAAFFADIVEDIAAFLDGRPIRVVTPTPARS